MTDKIIAPPLSPLEQALTTIANVYGALSTGPDIKSLLIQQQNDLVTLISNDPSFPVNNVEAFLAFRANIEYLTMANTFTEQFGVTYARQNQERAKHAYEAQVAASQADRPQGAAEENVSRKRTRRRTR